MKKNKFLLLAACITLTSAYLLSGCSNDKNTTIQKNAEASADESTEATFKESTGIIVDIDTDNNTITIANMKSGSMPNVFGNNGQQPELPSGDMQGQNGSDRPEMPSSDIPDMNGSERPEMPNGDIPDMNGSERPEMPNGDMSGMDGNEQFGMPSGNAMGDGTTFSVSDEVIITDEDGNKITLSDLKVNSFVSYTVENNTLLSITVQKMDNMPGGGMGGNGNGTPSEYTS